jgi:hypothetical protein
MKAARYMLIQGTLYKCGQTFPLLKYISIEEGAYILNEIHEVMYGNHMGGRVLSHKAMRMGYYWPRMYAGSMEMVQRCKECQ